MKIPMTKTVYKVVNPIPGFEHKVGTEFQVLNHEAYVKPSTSHFIKRVKEYDNFPFEAMMKSGYLSREEISNVEIPYVKGMLVVINKYGKEYFENASNLIDATPRNEIYKVVTSPIIKGKNTYYLEVRNVMNGNLDTVEIKKINGISKAYWFISSHGKIQMTYFWLRPVEDRYRIASGNVFSSYDEAKKSLDGYMDTSLSTTEKLQEFINKFE